MSTQTKGLVLVTGANGYVAARTVEALLLSGYSVRGSVRSLTSAEPLYAALPPRLHPNLSIVAVPDITSPGCFDSAVKGVDAIAHIAAPVSATFTDPEPVISLATTSILRALEAASTEPKVKSFVFMSSVAAIKPAGQDTFDLDESIWNDASLEVVKQLGRNTPPMVIYSASKTAAEKTLWEYRDEHKPNFSITALNPCFVAGPPLVTPSSIPSINFTTKFIFDVLSGTTPLSDLSRILTFPGFVDIRDVARMVVFSISEPEKADNQRFLLANAYSPVQAVADIIREKYPEYRDRVQVGTPGEGYFKTVGENGIALYDYPPERRYNGRKAVEVSGQDYIPWEQTIVHGVEAFKHLL
ncbi:hypothetical protein V8F20_008921 [Naviculisporaceae sp. PSN 640]